MAKNAGGVSRNGSGYFSIRQTVSSGLNLYYRASPGVATRHARVRALRRTQRDYIINPRTMASNRFAGMLLLAPGALRGWPELLSRRPAHYSTPVPGLPPAEYQVFQFRSHVVRGLPGGRATWTRGDHSARLHHRRNQAADAAWSASASSRSDPINSRVDCGWSQGRHAG